MSRIPLLTARAGLSVEQQQVFDSVTATRGTMIRPYQVLLHAPGVALPAAELGARIRYAGTLSDRDRELAILTVSTVATCGFEWDAHIDLARNAGVREEALEHLRNPAAKLNDGEALIIGFVRELSASHTLSEATFDAAAARLGNEGVVELSVLVGYYLMLAFVMNVAGAS